MHLALVTETYPPEINGVAMTLERLARGLASRGHRVDIIRPRQHPHDRATHPTSRNPIRQIPVPGLPLPRYDGLHFGLPAPIQLRRLWGHRSPHAPDVIHVATEGPLGLSAILAARTLSIPITSSFHTNFHQYGRHYGYGLLLRPVTLYLRLVHNRTALTLVPSTDVRDTLANDGFLNTQVLSRGVDTQLFNPDKRSEALRQSWGADSHTLVALSVGRVAGEKNLPLAIQAFHAIRDAETATASSSHASPIHNKGRDARLVIVGDGPLKAQLQRDHPDPHIHFVGTRRGEDLAAHYASSDLFLFPSTTETFGNVASEAMASGLAVVAYDYAGPRLLIDHRQSGILVPFDDAQAFIDAAVALTADVNAVRATGRRGRDAVLPFSWSRVVDTFEAALQEAVASSS